MLTARGWWFSLLSVFTLGLGLARNHATLTLLGLTLVLWFAWEWLLFAFRVRVVTRQLWVKRELRDDRGPVETLWAGRAFHVHVQLRLRGTVGLPYVMITERVPFGCERGAGAIQTDGEVTPAKPLELSYAVRCPTVGRLRFEGLAVQLADGQGFFYHATFIPDVVRYRVLAPLTDAEGHIALKKRHNLLPPPGVHRLRRPGSGSELLDLRDYLPGDPPKTIAWKASARRDRLITKEFESEVPVRCTLLVDTSNSVRVGPAGQNALARLVEIAAAVAQATAASRDLTGLCLFDDRRAQLVAPARSPRHLVYLLNLLADAVGLAPAARAGQVELLLPLTYSFAQEVYPYLMRSDLNQVPFWLPLLYPQPPFTKRSPTVGDHLGRWFSVLSARRRRFYAYRKRLAALLSVYYGLAPGGLAVLLEDDEEMGHYLQRFLAEHHVPYSLPLYDAQGRYVFATPDKLGVLADNLLRAVGKGHDNELFVLLADFLELPDQLGPVLRAVKVALARHHQVLVVCPWPPDMPPPGGQRPLVSPRRPAVRARGPRPDGQQPAAVPEDVRQAMLQAITTRFHRAFDHVKRTFARLGVPVVCAQSGDPARLILQRLDRLRSVGRGR